MQVPLEHTRPREHSSSAMHDVHSWLAVQVPLAHPPPFALQPARQAPSALQYFPVGHWSSAGLHSVQVCPAVHTPMPHSELVLQPVLQV
jgi:hypothetical protein